MGCGAPEGGVQVTEAGDEAVVAGEVRRGDQPVHPAYVRLLDSSGEFVAEVATDASGAFRFYAAPGQWTVRALAPGVAAVDSQVEASRGRIVRITLQM
ncbi:MAG: DUF1416 domain-containing protein [Streptosporangiales bacterium]